MATSSYAPPHTVDVVSAPAVADDDGDHYSASVSAAISELLPDDDPFCRADFDVTAYINTLFPTEQSLSQLDDVMDQVGLSRAFGIQAVLFLRFNIKSPTWTEK
jgi:hypothetical protein